MPVLWDEIARLVLQAQVVSLIVAFILVTIPTGAWYAQHEAQWLRAAAAVAKGRSVADHVQALVVPGSGLVKHQAEDEGLDKIFSEAGFEWRNAGCI